MKAMRFAVLGRHDLRPFRRWLATDIALDVNTFGQKNFGPVTTLFAGFPNGGDHHELSGLTVGSNKWPNILP